MTAFQLYVCMYIYVCDRALCPMGHQYNCMWHVFHPLLDRIGLTHVPDICISKISSHPYAKLYDKYWTGRSKIRAAYWVAEIVVQTDSFVGEATCLLGWREGVYEACSAGWLT